MMHSPPPRKRPAPAGGRAPPRAPPRPAPPSSSGQAVPLPASGACLSLPQELHASVRDQGLMTMGT